MKYESVIKLPLTHFKGGIRLTKLLYDMKYESVKKLPLTHFKWGIKNKDLFK